MTKFIALALLSLTFATDLKQKLEGDGLLFHSIDFLGDIRTPGDFANYWYSSPNESLYLSSFSYVNSARPKVAARSGILVDPKHPDVKLHAIAHTNGLFNGYKGIFTGQTSNACTPSSAQFVREKQIVERACTGAFQYANDIYSSSWYSHQPAKGFFNRSNMINKLKENDRNVRIGAWSEIVASVPAQAIAGVIDFDNAPIRPPYHTQLYHTERVEGLCSEMRKKNPNIPCYRAQSGVITPLMPLPTPPRVPTQPTPASPTPVQSTPAQPSQPTSTPAQPAQPTSTPAQPAQPTSTPSRPMQPRSEPHVPDQPTPAPPSNPPREPAPTHRRSTPILVICFITVTMVCVLASGVYRYLNSKKRKEKDYPAEKEKAERDENEQDFALSVSSLASWPSGSLTLRKRRSLTSMSFEEM